MPWPWASSSSSFAICTRSRSIHLFTSAYLSPKTKYSKNNMVGSNGGDRYTLKYFNFRVLGEPIRWQFALSGVPFQDVRLQRDTWDSDDKNRTGWGRLPILIINDSIEITQSTAISRYLAGKFGLLPNSELERVRCDELVDNLQDLRLLCRPWLRESDKGKKQILKEELLRDHLPFYLGKTEDFIKTHGAQGYAVGTTLSWADLYLANFMEIWSGDENFGPELLSPYPLILQQLRKILCIPQIQEWNSQRPKTSF